MFVGFTTTFMVIWISYSIDWPIGSDDEDGGVRRARHHNRPKWVEIVQLDGWMVCVFLFLFIVLRGCQWPLSIV